jgi:hypothetical protein
MLKYNIHTNNLYTFLFSPIRATCPAHITLIMLGAVPTEYIHVTNHVTAVSITEFPTGRNDVTIL